MAIKFSTPVNMVDDLHSTTERLLSAANGDSKKFSSDEHKKAVNLADNAMSIKQGSENLKMSASTLAGTLGLHDGSAAKNPFSNERLKTSYSDGQRSADKFAETKAKFENGKSAGTPAKSASESRKTASQNIGAKLNAAISNAKSAGESAKATTDKEIDRALKKV